MAAVAPHGATPRKLVGPVRGAHRPAAGKRLTVPDAAATGQFEFTHADEIDRRPAAGAPRARAYKSASSTDRRGRALPGSRANPRHARGDASRTNAARRAGSVPFAHPPAGRTS